MPDDWHLIVPFVVCRSCGGPYDDASFVRGFEVGRIAEKLARHDWDEIAATVHEDVVHQLDLIAMRQGYVIIDRPEDETAAEGFADVVFRRVDGDADDV